MEYSWKKALIIVVILAIVAVLLSLLIPKDGMYSTVFNAQQAANTSEQTASTQNDQPIVQQDMTIEGVIECLPHRNTSGPTTMECAYGLKGDNGYYYALDTSAYSGPAGSMYEVGDHVRITGTTEDITSENAKQWEIYNIVGSIMVKNYEKI